MTTCAASPDGNWQLIMSIALMNKVSTFMRQIKNCPNLNQIHEKTLKNDCLENVSDVRRFIKIELSNTFIFYEEQDPPPPQAIVTNICFSKAFQS